MDVVPAGEALGQGACSFIQSALGSFWEPSVVLGSGKTDVNETRSLPLGQSRLITQTHCNISCSVLFGMQEEAVAGTQEVGGHGCRSGRGDVEVIGASLMI